MGTIFIKNAIASKIIKGHLGYEDWVICPFFIENIWMAKTGIVYFVGHVVIAAGAHFGK